MSKSLFFIAKPLFEEPNKDSLASGNLLSTIFLILSNRTLRSASSLAVCLLSSLYLINLFI